MTDLIVAGDEIKVTLSIANNKPDSSKNIIVTDIIPDKTQYKQGSANISPKINGNTMTWNFDGMAPLEKKEITFTLLSDRNIKSVLHWAERIEDDIEVFDTKWKDLSVKGNNYWDATDEYPHEGPWAFYIYNDPAENDQHLFMRHPLQLNQNNPAIRFYHWYDLTINNGKPTVGTVELSVNDGPYTLAKDLFVKNGFTGPIPYGTFAEPFYQGFYGSSNGFIQSYIDLSAYKGQKVKLKFRFGNESLDNVLPTEKPYGWVIDDIELIDMKSYNSEACVEAKDIDQTCVSAPGRGAIVEVGETVGTNNVLPSKSKITILPNPAIEQAVLKFHIPDATKGFLEVLQKDIVIYNKHNVSTQVPFTLPVHNWTSGMYLVRFTTKSKTYVQKLIIAN